MSILLSLVQTVGGVLGILSAAILLSERLFRNRPYANFLLQKPLQPGDDPRVAYLHISNTAKATIILTVPSKVSEAFTLSKIGGTREVIRSVLAQREARPFILLLRPGEEVSLHIGFAPKAVIESGPESYSFRIAWRPAQRSHLIRALGSLPSLSLPLYLTIRRNEILELRNAVLEREEILYGEDEWP